MHEQLTRWWNGVSLRSKITGVTVMLLTLGLLVAGVGTMSFLRNYLLDDVKDRISLTAADPATAVSIACGPSRLLPATYMYMAVIDDRGKLMCQNSPIDAPVPVVSAKTLPGVIRVDQPFTLLSKLGTSSWRVVGVPLTKSSVSDHEVAVLIGVNLDETNSIIGRFALIFMFFSLFVVLLGGALTRLLVTSTFTPLREVEDTAARFAAGDFSQRLEHGSRNTEVGRLNDSLNQMLSRIDSSFADRVKTIEQMRRFVGDASHELRTPLVSVRGYAELYRMGALTSREEVASAMERIEKEAIRMGELVEDLLELARIDEAKPLALADVDLVPLAHDAAMDAMASAPDRRVTVVVTAPILRNVGELAGANPRAGDVAPHRNPRTASVATRSVTFAATTLSRLRTRRPRRADNLEVETVIENAKVDTNAVVRAEENKIRQVITNLMGNALRFTPVGSPIEIAITVDEPDSTAIVSVIDHGEGIPPQIRDKIFQRFWRADTSRNRDTGGSGLGLAIVASIVATHKGSVDVVETAGGGSTFRVRLPLATSATSATESTTTV